MKTNFAYSDIADELCRGCRPASHPGSRFDSCKWCDVTLVTETIWHALNESTPIRHRVSFYSDPRGNVPPAIYAVMARAQREHPTRRRVAFYSDPRDNVPPAGYVVMAVYGDIVGIVTERQYKRALKNEYVNQTYGIWYAVTFPVFIQRPDGSLYLPRDPEHDN